MSAYFLSGSRLRFAPHLTLSKGNGSKIACHLDWKPSTAWRLLVASAGQTTNNKIKPYLW